VQLYRKVLKLRDCRLELIEFMAVARLVESSESN
jgi:hypothetical protein